MSSSSLARRALVSVLVLAAWLAFALGVVPSIVTSAYHQTSLPIFNSLIISRESHPLAEYLDYWHNVALLGAVWAAGWWTVAPLHRWLTSPRFFEQAVGAATPGTLGAIRSWVCGTLLVMTLWEDLASTALLPRDMAQPKGLLHLLHALPVGFERFLASPGALWTFEHLTALLLALGVVGLGTRVVLPAAALCYFLLAGILREYSWFYHTGLIPLYVVIALCFTRCGDGWSIDRLIRIGRGRPAPRADAPQPVYGWGRYLVWATIAVPYVAAALSKLYYGGITWFHPDNMLATLLRTTLGPMEFEWEISLLLVEAPAFVLVFLAAVGLFSELLFGLVLVSRRARLVLPVAIFATHAGILFLQNILFIDLLLLQAVFYDWSPLVGRLGRWIREHYGTVDVLYDGRCGLCGRTVRALRGLDLFGRFVYVDFRSAPLDDYASRTTPTLDPGWLEHEMAVVQASGRLTRGFSAYRVMAWSLPLSWPLLPFVYLPGVRPLGDFAYKYVAERRQNVCQFGPEPVSPKLAPARVHWRGAAAALGLTLFLMSWWVTHIEFYPFTTLKMFAALNLPLGTINYTKAFVIDEDGRRERARFEEWIGAMADSRYRQMLVFAFQGPAEVQRSNEFLEASMRAANAQHPGSPRIVGFDVEMWEWDFARDPRSSTRGRLIDTHVYRAQHDAHRD